MDSKYGEHIKSNDEMDLYDYLNKRVEENKHFFTIDISEMDFKTIEEENLFKCIIRKIKNIIENPVNYYADLKSMLFLGLLHNIPEQDHFKYKFEKIEAEKNIIRYLL